MTRARVAAAIGAVVIALYVARAVSPADPAATPPIVKVTLGDVGLEAGSLDRTADPCVDFYQFACGGWIQNNPIPPDRARWDRHAEIDDRTKLAIKAILDEAARGQLADPQGRKLGDFYASCLDEPAVERAGTSALRTLLAKTSGVKDAASWLAAVIELHKLGIPAVWRDAVGADFKASSTNAIYLDVAGLGLPGRDYYLAADYKDKLDRYQLHVGKLLATAAAQMRPLPADAAQSVVAIETELARLSRTAIEQRELSAIYNPTDVKALARQAKSVDWPKYFAALGQPAAATKKLIVGTPAFFASLDKLRAKFKPAQWASYFTYHLLQATAVALPRAFDDEAFALSQLLTGVEKQRERGRRCIDLTSRTLGDALGREYVARYVPASTKQAAGQLVDAVGKAMTDEIASLDWMSDATKQIATAKLTHMVRTIGYPDQWKSYDYDVKRDDFAGNLLRSMAFEAHRELARAGAPVDRGEWQQPAYQVDAYYNATANAMALPAGMLQSPFFGQDRSVAANLGGIGSLIGHELTHGFDDQGAQFDADGNLHDWWQPADHARFADKGKCIADEYSGFEAQPKKFVQGQLTLGEDIADNGGVKMAFKAYRSLRTDAARRYVADGYTEDQQFFIAAGQAWCARARPADIERRLAVDPHAPPKFRIYGALRNLPEFADAFHCVAGTPMRPAHTCSVW